MYLSVIVPAYNESGSIRKNLRKISSEISRRTASSEIIFVDDGSIDGTLKEAKKSNVRKIRFFRYPENRGKGYAIKFGAQHAKGKFVAFLDADLEIEASRVFELVKELESGSDVAIFSKNHPLSRINFPLYRRLLSRLYYVFAKALFRLPVTDTQTGCKAFRREVLDKVLPSVYTKEFAFDLELLAYARDYGFRIVELPIRINFARERGRIKMRNVWRMFLDTVIIFFRLHIKRIHRKPL